MQRNLIAATVLATAAIALGSPVAAELNAKNYVFGTPNGGAYCNGITLTRSGKDQWGGQQTGCDSDPAGGFTATINTNKYIEAATTYVEQGMSGAYILYLDTRDRYWYLYTCVPNGSGYVWTGVNNGILLRAHALIGVRRLPQSNVQAKPGVRLDHMLLK
jgi:hypothetical protein